MNMKQASGLKLDTKVMLLTNALNLRGMKGFRWQVLVALS